jgi:hypothetical protein
VFFKEPAARLKARPFKTNQGDDSTASECYTIQIVLSAEVNFFVRSSSVLGGVLMARSQLLDEVQE